MLPPLTPALLGMARSHSSAAIQTPETVIVFRVTAQRSYARSRALAVAWTRKFANVRAMTTSNALRSEIPNRSHAAIAAERAPLKLEQFLPYQLNVVAALVSQALSHVYTRRYRIGVPEWRVLVTLGQFRVMTGKAIGTHTHMHKTKVSRAVALLEKRKLLARRSNRADMRETLLSLTAAGREVYEELAPHALDFARRLTDILPPADRQAFHRALDLIADRSAQLVAETIGQVGAAGET
jgi:DNA-binding MarR family transcriptional regulator